MEACRLQWWLAEWLGMRGTRVTGHCHGLCLVLVTKVLRDRDAVLFTDVLPMSSKSSADSKHSIVSAVVE